MHGGLRLIIRAMTIEVNAKRRERPIHMLNENDPAPVLQHNRDATGPVLFTCEHAGRATPAVLGDMGVSDADWERHIAWDVGALALAESLADRMGCRLISQRYSRLVIDCNRALISPELIPEASDRTVVPANEAISDAERQSRIDAIHAPFHDCVAAEIERQRPRLIFPVHSFTPRMNDQDRPWHGGFLANRMPEAAESLLMATAGRAPYLNFALNEPYTVDDISDYTVPVHGEQNAIPHALVEVRNDQLLHESGIEFWADLLGRAIEAYLRSEPK
jgi:predicted N-formylglutamate amidohydrolase